MVIDGITRHVFWGPDERTCLCGGKTIVLDEHGRVIDETVTMTPSEMEAMAAYLSRPRC
jgi:hypothetical protein